MQRYWTKADASGLRPDWVKRIRLILSRLDVAQTAAELDIPGLGFHALNGDMAGRYSVIVSRNWRITLISTASTPSMSIWRIIMAETIVRHPDIEPAHPGELLAEIVIPATGLTKTEIARRLGVSRQTLHDILAQRQPVTPSVAVRLGKLFGDGGRVWLRMQAEHDYWRAAREIDVSSIEPVRAA